MPRILVISKRDARVFIDTLTNKADEGRSIKDALKLRSIQRKFREYLGEFGTLYQEIIDGIDETNMEMDPTNPEYRTRMMTYQRRMQYLDDNEGIAPAANDVCDGILLDNEEFNFLKSQLHNLRGIPASGRAGERWEGIHEAFENAKEAKISKAEAVKESESA